MKSYRGLVIKELFSQKITSILILVAVILSTTMTAIIGQSIETLLTMREQQAITIGGNKYVTFLQVDDAQLQELKKDPRLSYIGESIYLGQVSLTDSLSLGLTEYVDDSYKIYPSDIQVKEGRLPERRNEIALPDEVLSYLGKDINVGDKIELSLEKSLRHNIADSYSYTGEFVLTGILSTNYLGYTGGMLTGLVGEGTAENLLPRSHMYYNVDIRTNDKNTFQSVINDIKDQLDMHELDISYNIVYLNALGISYDNKSNDVGDTGFPFMIFAGVLIGGLVLLAAGLVIYNILKIAICKRIKEYGTLRAIGAEKTQLYEIVLYEIITLCFVGIPIGMFLGSFSARGILTAVTGLISPEVFLVQDMEELKTVIEQNSSINVLALIISGAITLIFAMLAALPAVRLAGKVSPIVAMSGIKTKIRRKRRKIKKIYNFEAYFARLNMKRNKGRTIITILSLVMSITVFIALQGFSSILNAANVLQDSHIGDYQITNTTKGFTQQDLKELETNENVDSVAAIQFALYEQNEEGMIEDIKISFQLLPNETFQVVGLNDTYWDYFMEDTMEKEQLEKLKAGQGCIVRNPIPINMGEKQMETTTIEKGSKIKIGDTELEVYDTLDGYEGYLGIGNEGFTNGVQVIVDDSIYSKLTNINVYSELLPTLKPNSDKDSFEESLEKLKSKTPGTTILSYEKTDEQLEESFAQIELLANGLILFIGLIGVLNIINTVYTNIHTRIAEIGMQRAVGMSIKSLYKIFLWEGAWYGLIAAFIGSVLGYICDIFIGAAISGTLRFVPIPITDITIAIIVSVLACLIATSIPLRKIAKMCIVDAIETVE